MKRGFLEIHGLDVPAWNNSVEIPIDRGEASKDRSRVVDGSIRLDHRLKMLKLKLTGSFVLMCAAITCAPRIARGTEVQSYISGYGSAGAPLVITGDFPIGLTFQKFDGLQGMLTGVNITLTSTYNLQASVANIGNASIFQNAAAAATLTLDDLGGTGIQTTLATTPISNSIGAGSPTAPAFFAGPAIQNTLVTSFSVSPADFGLYEGNSQSGSSFVLNLTADASFSGAGNSSLLFGGSATAYGTVGIDYLYTHATTVPEPGVAGLGALGLCAIAVAHRIRSKQGSGETAL